jgi:superfamily II DNA helicase RecQ
MTGTKLQTADYLRTVMWCLQVAIEALGLGVDIMNIQRGVQHGIHPSRHVVIFLQRGGWADRDGKNGSIILLDDEWVLLLLLNHGHQTRARTPTSSQTLHWKHSL